MSQIVSSWFRTKLQQLRSHFFLWELCSLFKILPEIWHCKNQLMLKVCIPLFNLSIFFHELSWARIFNLSIKTIQPTPKQQRSQMWKLSINYSYLVMNSGRRLRKRHASIWLPCRWKATKAGQNVCNDSSFIDATWEAGRRKRWPFYLTFTCTQWRKRGSTIISNENLTCIKY